MLLTLLCIDSAADHTPHLANMPKQPIEIKKVFLDAWLTLRRDLDGITGISSHPNVIEAWFRTMPDYMLRDALRLATQHEVIYQAAQRLLVLGGSLNRAAVINTLKRHEETPLGDQLTMLLILRGESAITKRVAAALKRPLSQHKIKAAILLAGGGNKIGMKYLKQRVQEPSEEGASAVTALGRYGDLKEMAKLERLIKRHPLSGARRAALGELALRYYLPKLYSVFSMQHRFDRHRYTENGLYEIWMDACGSAISSGAKTIPALTRQIVLMRRDPPASARNAEVVRRQLTQFSEFLESATVRLDAPVEPPWPTSFQEATFNLGLIRSREIDTDTLMARRISAGIALIAETGARLGYPTLASPTPGLRALSASGERTLDGNLATSWQIKKAGHLILEHTGARLLDTVHVMLGCPYHPNALTGPVAVEISGTDNNNTPWQIRGSLDSKDRFFQEISISKRSSGRVTLTISPASHKDAVCIPEIRMHLTK
jgi:hypothetical protein